jgi:hypothetical protein
VFLKVPRALDERVLLSSANRGKEIGVIGRIVEIGSLREVISTLNCVFERL